jgi:hypothetical protein
LGEYQHGLFYSVRGTKKDRDYVEPMFSAFQSEYGYADNRDRNIRVVSLLLAGEVRVDLLKAALPEANIYLAGSNSDQPIQAEELQMVHYEAEKYSVTIPDLVI